VQLENEPDISVFRPDRPGIRKVLGDLEADIMEVIWSRPADKGTTVRDVFEILYKGRSIAYTTVMTTMNRLAKKRLLRAEKHDQAFVYSPNFTEDEFILRFVGRVLEDLLVSFAGPTLDRLDKLPDQQAAESARRLLGEIVRRRGEDEQE